MLTSSAASHTAAAADELFSEREIAEELRRQYFPYPDTVGAPGIGKVQPIVHAAERHGAPHGVEQHENDRRQHSRPKQNIRIDFPNEKERFILPLPQQKIRRSPSTASGSITAGSEKCRPSEESRFPKS